MQSGDDDETSIQSSGDVDPVHRALRNTPTTPWAPLTGNKERLTEAYLARWFEGLASKENYPKLAAKAKRYAEILVEENDLMTGLSILKCDDLFLEKKVGMAKSHIQLMKDNIMKRSPSPPQKGQGNMGNSTCNQEVLNQTP